MTTMGEGGMITTNDDELAHKLYQMRSYGGEEMWGMNYRMSKIQAVFGIEQLKKLDFLNNCRIKNAKRRGANLDGCKKLVTPKNNDYSNHIYYLYALMLTPEYSLKKRDEIINRLEIDYGIICSVPKFINERWNYIKKKFKIPVLKNTSYATEKLICPIMHSQITEEQENYISSALLYCLEQ
jgi:dTDP-4-amino-4,6-dideoxygalactose transaminase